jgi:hypothetical protein
MFGAARFGAAALKNSVSAPNLGRRAVRVLLGGLCGIIAWCSLHPFDDNLTMSFKASAACLTVAAAVLTGDFVSGRCRVEQVRTNRRGRLKRARSRIGNSLFPEPLGG